MALPAVLPEQCQARVLEEREGELPAARHAAVALFLGGAALALPDGFLPNGDANLEGWVGGKKKEMLKNTHSCTPRPSVLLLLFLCLYF
jgi:hypothetical protein